MHDYHAKEKKLDIILKTVMTYTENLGLSACYLFRDFMY